MAMPSSGCIALRNCISNCACSSISCAVTGAAQTPASLSSLSVCAGKTAPHGMREFYGYSSSKSVTVSLCTTTSGGSPGRCGCDWGCICVEPALAGSECVDIGLCYELFACMTPNSTEERCVCATGTLTVGGTTDFFCASEDMAGYGDCCYVDTLVTKDCTIGTNYKVEVELADIDDDGSGTYAKVYIYCVDGYNGVSPSIGLDHCKCVCL